jgi:hypothetical protein
MSVVQTRNKKMVFGILLSALIVGVMLTIGQVPLAVSQPVTIPVKAIKGPIPMDGANPVWEGVPGVVVPLSGQTITTPMHPNIAVKSVFVKAVSNGKELGFRLDWSDQTKNAMILPARCRRIRIGPWPRILAGECSTFLEVVCGISRIVISKIL